MHERHDLGAPQNRSHPVGDVSRVLSGRGRWIAGSANDQHGSERLVVNVGKQCEHRDIEEVARERSPDQCDRLGRGQLGQSERLQRAGGEIVAERVPDGELGRRQDRYAVEEVDVELEQRPAAVRVDVWKPQVGHRVARALLGDLVAGRTRERFDLGEQFRAAQLRLLGISVSDEVEIDVDGESWQLEMKKVERRTPTQQKLVAEPLADLPEKLRESEDGLERAGAEAALAGDSREVSAVGESVHAASVGADRRCAGTITFQRVTTRPPRVPGSR